MSSRPSISAFIVCCNEEAQIRRCLESVRWCDEIVVVDSGSTDNTLEICKEFTDRVLHRPWSGYVEQKRYGLEQCRSEWTLNLDADEEVSLELKEEIIGELEKWNSLPPEKRPDGFFVNRVVFFLGRWWRNGGWYPEYRLRICRTAVTTWGGVDPHEKAIVNGKTVRLMGELFHYTYDDINDQVRRINSLSSDAANSLVKSGKRAGIFDMISRPPLRFFKFYVLKRGYREGVAGFAVAILEGLQVFLKYAKAWERQPK